MKLKTLLLRGGVVVLIATSVAQYVVYRQAQEQAKRIASQFLGYGQLRYERVWANLWGSGSAWNLSFEPTGITQALLRSPLGYRIYARELRIHRFRAAADGKPGLIEATLRGVRVPVIETRSASAGALPTLSELGYTELGLELDFRLRLSPDTETVALQVNAAGPELAKLYLDTEIEGGAARFRNAPDQLLLRRLRLEYADRGLIAQAKQLMAARARIGEPALEQAVIEQLDRRSARGRWRWNAASVKALKGFVRDSDYAMLTLAPPGEVRLRNLNLYAARDWPVLLGFEFSTAGAFRHPAPGKPLP